MKTKRDNYKFLTQAPVHKVILTMALPTIISMLVTSLYNMADTFFVSKINTQCTAAVGIVFSVMSVIQAVGFFLGMVRAITYRASLAHAKRPMLVPCRPRDLLIALVSVYY